MTPAAALDQVRTQLARIGESRVRAGMERFFKETIRAHGVASPKVRDLAREAFREAKGWTPAERNRFCTELLRSGMFEEGALAIYLYRRFARACHECEFRLFERWIDRYVDNWAWCDGVSSWLVAASLANEPSLLVELPAWTASANRWKRRAAAVSMVPFGRRGEQTAAILDIADRLRGDEDDLVRKGAGWLLKDSYPKKPRELVRFLKASRPPFARLVLRIAAEKMTAEDRAAVLG